MKDVGQVGIVTPKAVDLIVRSSVGQRSRHPPAGCKGERFKIHYPSTEVAPSSGGSRDGGERVEELSEEREDYGTLSHSGARAGLKRIIVHPALHETVTAMRRVGVRLPPDPATGTMAPEPISHGDAKITLLEPTRQYRLDPKAGRQLVSNGPPIFAYDESFQKYSALEGAAQFTAHALVTIAPDQYLPIVFLSAYFYTRARSIGDKQPVLRYSDDPAVEAQKDYMRDRISLLSENVPPGALLIIDGPIIAGDAYTTFLPFIRELHAKDIIPVFVVKNSESSLVLDAVPGWREQYNSDLHWAHRTLEVGERSPLFQYQDLHNPHNSKVFAYLRTTPNSPLRVEFHVDTYSRYRDQIMSLLDVCHYLVLVQGDSVNPQPRPVAIAEMYAREALKVLDVQSLMRRAHLVPTMNQIRFGGA